MLIWTGRRANSHQEQVMDQAASIKEPGKESRAVGGEGGSGCWEKDSTSWV